MAQMRAVKIVEAGKAEVQTVNKPALRDDYVLAKVHSVALNPTDWKHIDYLATPGVTVGCDFAGVVEEVGSKVTKKWSKGDRILGFTHGANKRQPEDGCFGEYAVAKGDLAIKVPEGVSFEEAATLGVGLGTCGLGLYKYLDLPLPGKDDGKGGWLLVYGGSTATGSLAIQLGRLSGYRVISINSPHNNSFVESVGAEKAFDYHDKEIGKKIREYTNDELTKVFDCISEGDSPKICGQAISSKGGQITYLLMRQTSGRDDVKEDAFLGYSAMGEEFEKAGHTFPASPEIYEFAKSFGAVSEKLIAEGKLKAHPRDVRQGGLDGIVGGLNDLRTGKVSGKKVVYNVV